MRFCRFCAFAETVSVRRPVDPPPIVELSVAHHRDPTRFVLHALMVREITAKLLQRISSQSIPVHDCRPDRG